MKISNQGLLFTVSLAILSIFGLNYWVYNVDFVSAEKEKLDELWGCGTTEPNLVFSGTEDRELYDLGEGIFNANCTQCHAIHEKVVGPALKNVWQRWETEEQLIQFIKYPQKTIDSGKNQYATLLYKKYKQYMPNHDFLTDEEAKGLIAYIKGQSGYNPSIVAYSAVP